MTNKKIELNTPLTKDDVELRIGTTSENGFSLLIYKTARTDIKRLTDVFGLLWKNKHFYDGKDLLCCEISIKVKDEWVGRSDVGTESTTEKEKGSYSDSFKRAGFRWGIGLELYRSPFIWVNWTMQPNKTGKGFVPVKFYASNLEIKDYQVKDGIPHITIKYESRALFSNLGAKVGKKKPEESKKTIIDNPMSSSQRNYIENSVEALSIKDAGETNKWLRIEHTYDEAKVKIAFISSIINK